MKPSYYFAILFFSFCGISNLNSQIVINEYSASNLDQFPDDYSKFEDWFELYNASDEVVDLSGWYASDKATKPTKWEFPAGVTISPKGYLKVWCSGRDSVSDFGIHTDFKLSQTTGDEVISLANANGNLVDIVPLELTHLGHSRGRVTDGSPLWKVFISPSIEVTNNDSEGYEGYTDAPLISLAPGFYEGEQKLILDADFQGVEVYYTTDGNLPTKSSIKYIEGTEIIIHKTQVLKARAYSVDPNVLPGKIAFASYFIGEKLNNKFGPL